MKKRTILFPIFLLVLAMISIQSGAALAKSLFPIIGSFGMTALRLFWSTIVLFIFFKPWKTKIYIDSIKYLILYGISLGSMNSFFYLALEKIPLGITVALEFMGPLTISIFYSRRNTDLIWIIMAIVGIFLLIPINEKIPILDNVGILYALLAGVFWGIYIIFGQVSGIKYGSSTVAIGSFISTLFFFPIGVYITDIDILFNSKIIPISFIVSILSTAFPYTLEMFALTRISTNVFSILMSIEPAIATIIGIIFLNEKLTFLQFFALLLIILASIGTTSTNYLIKKKNKLKN
ncbi:MAG: EamA family transporter [Arsenophonus sp.]|nr:MAG: EamA family transporter [Arsenophonus sp.]